ncbi:MAG: trypsin-like peptidase domain-containing protein [Alphaproteobacteria bacterium]|nr:trypsin-like peptidase domain-containing protein [Alphaproteobacteria bacterium]
MKLKSTLFRTLLPCLLAVMVTGCAELVVKQVDYAPTLEIPPHASPTPIEFKNFRVLLPPGTEIGFESGAGPMLLGEFCSWNNYPVSRRVLSRKFEKQYLDLAFENALESQGYDVTNDVDLEFRADDAAQRAEYFISAKVIDVDLDLCRRGRITSANIFNSAPRAKGKLYAKIEWSVYDALRRTTIYKTTTEGYTRRDYPNTEALELLFMDAFEMAAHNLGADQGFYDLLVHGEKPETISNRLYNQKIDDDYPRNFNPEEEVAISAPPLSKAPFSAIAHDARKVAVLVQKSGHGSGFFITKQGHILTNYHVVGDARRMRIVTGFRKTGITAEVLRVDRARDVALLKLEEIPDWLNIDDIMIRPVRTDWPRVGEDVYAIGVPKDWKTFRNTVTKGIVSGHRRYKRVGAIRSNFIQADVEIHPGSSGGPMLDQYGNLVGIAVEGYTAGSDNDHSPVGIGLNLFIPIQEALDTLNISYDGQE